MLFESMDDSSGPPHHGYADWCAERRPVLLDDAVFATPSSVPINGAARRVLRELGVTAVRVERLFSLTGAEIRASDCSVEPPWQRRADPGHDFARSLRRQQVCQRQWRRTRASADWRVWQRLAPLGEAVLVMSPVVQCNGLAFAVVRTHLADGCAVGARALAHKRVAPAPGTILSRCLAYIEGRAARRVYTW